MERRLAAILIADVVGYSRLTQIDDVRTRAQFQADRDNIFLPAIHANRGRLVKTLGDGLLIEFSSVVDALNCAITVQQQKAEEEIPAQQRMRFRIGINLGDVLIEGDDVHGDGVIIAERLQTIAEPGGIAISGSAYDQVRSRVHVGYVELGGQRVKGIAEPVRVYRVLLGPAARGKTLSRRKRRLISLTVAAAGLSVLAAAGVIWGPLGDFRGLLQTTSPAGTRFAYPLPDKPSVAVLPFINVSGDQAHDHLAEGLTDDLITELSKVSGLFVIARHSVFAVQKTSGTIQDVASELGVQYVLEGTLQREGPRLRINVKLIEALSGLSLWAERYDRQYADLFAVQDDVIGKIISALSITLSQGEQKQLSRMPTDNLEAYDYYTRAEHEGAIYGDVGTYRRALSFYQKAIDLDPKFANAHAGIARIAVDVWRNDYNFLWSAAIARKIAYDAAGEALKLDPSNARAHVVLAFLQWVDGRDAEALDSANTAIAMQPNDAEAFGNLALILAHTGKRSEAVSAIDKALRLDPSPAPGFKLLAGIVLYVSGADQRAIPLIEGALTGLPKAEPAREYLAAAYANLGQPERARQEVALLLSLFPEANVNYYRYLYDYWESADLERHLSALKAAGLPDWPFNFRGEDSYRVTGHELTALIADQTWNGKHKNGTSFVQYFGNDGVTAYRSANTSMTGEASIENGRLCERFEGYFLDRSVCGEIFRNPAADRGDAPYIYVTPRSLQFFSAQNN
jgi:adenylate cyclase